MSMELLYTSAPQGLKQGSRGFSTVVCTTGMPINVANRLESLSGYRHVFPPNHAQASSNPVCFSHLKFMIGGKSTSILSRISDYGVDYSQRTNKLAHHVVLDVAEQPEAGPAWLLSQAGFMRSSWDGRCSTLPGGPTIPAGNVSPAICHTWQKFTGDAGWGGVVAEAFLSQGAKPLWIIFRLQDSTRLLTLLNESIALLAPQDRWQATFSTYTTNLPPEADCKVRCVLDGSDEARVAAGRGTVINLAKQVTLTDSVSPLVQAARTGRVATIAGRTAASLPIRSDELSDDELLGHEDDALEECQLESMTSSPLGSPKKPPTLKPHEPPVPHLPKPKTPSRSPAPTAKVSNPTYFRILIGGGVTVALACIVLIAYLLSQPIVSKEMAQRDSTVVQEPADRSATNNREPKPEPDPIAPTAQPTQPQPKPEPPKPEPPEPEPPEPEPPEPEPPKPERPEQTPIQAPSTSETPSGGPSREVDSDNYRGDETPLRVNIEKLLNGVFYGEATIDLSSRSVDKLWFNEGDESIELWSMKAANDGSGGKFQNEIQKWSINGKELTLELQIKSNEFREVSKKIKDNYELTERTIAEFNDLPRSLSYSRPKSQTDTTLTRDTLTVPLLPTWDKKKFSPKALQNIDANVDNLKKQLDQLRNGYQKAIDQNEDLDLWKQELVKVNQLQSALDKAVSRGKSLYAILQHATKIRYSRTNLIRLQTRAPSAKMTGITKAPNAENAQPLPIVFQVHIDGLQGEDKK